ncbi:Alg9-like mannosyltransferase family-domain-containing protein [Syncephalis fuscata]|nr:Alg9-like mannosyltransferase family-domain-containing protein [Syncephalis fuscata]
MQTPHHAPSQQHQQRIQMKSRPHKLKTQKNEANRVFTPEYWRQGASWSPDWLDLLLFVLASFHVVVAPFTKVEEQFNVEAVHDLLYYGWTHLDEYNHTAYPGPVPRTFIGPIVLYIIVKPVQLIWHSINPVVPKVYFLIIARCALAAITILSLSRFRFTVQKIYGNTTAIAFALICAVQFHLIFWAGRTIPNTFAFSMVTVAFAYWIEGANGRPNSIYTALRIILVAGLLFRSELAALFVPWALFELFSGRLQFLKAVQSGLWAGLYAIPTTVVIDSYFWQKFPKWPEFDVFWFNAIDLRSSEWGVSPWHAYFTTLIPRILHVALPLVAYGAWSSIGLRRYLWPMLIFVCLYSGLGHKEWRFVMYITPIVNLAAAVGFARLFNNRWKHLKYRVLCGTVVVSGMLYISSLNYPGVNKTNVYMHMDVLTHMTGGSGFSQQRMDWRYSRNESHTLPEDYEKYTHLVTEAPDFHQKAFKEFASIRGLAGIGIKRPREYMQDIIIFMRQRDSFNRLLPLRINMPNLIWLMRRRLADET